ncbi:MAG: hypothetical protein ABSA17_04950 [Rhabdochlamydiaceae bacterium]|jgi:hypothetical protein
MSQLLPIAVCLLFASMLTADDANPPRKAYASIDTSRALIEKFQAPTTSDSARKKISEKIAEDPGSYHPMVLLLAGLEYLKVKEYDKAAVLCAGAMLRAEIDIRLSEDRTLDGALFSFQIVLGETFEKYLTETEEQQKWQTAWEIAIKNFEAWDRSTPGNYDADWIRPHSMKAFTKTDFKIADKNKEVKIIERFYRELKGELAEEDYEDASKDDECFFDRTTRIFYFNGAQFSFLVPKQFVPQLDRWGKYDSSFKLPNQASLLIEKSWSAIPMSFQEDYDYQVANKKEDVAIEERVYNGIRAYRERYMEKDSIVNAFYIVKDNYSFNFKLYSEIENEESLLQEMEILLNSIQF